jgi:oxaloacetate decarboxylase alpha subunit
MAMGTSQPPTETFVAAVQGTPYDTGLDLNQLNKISKHFAPLREKYLASGQLNPKALAVDVNALLYQVPGGMLSNLMKQLSDAGRSHQLTEVLEEVPRVRADVGYPPLVTPSSQIVGTQAVYNVIMGQRYKTVTKEFKGIVRGEYGKTPVPIDPEFRKKILGDANVIDHRPADDLKPELDELRAKIPAGYIEQDEDVLSYALFEQVALKFFEHRKNKKYGIDENAAGGVHTI